MGARKGKRSADRGGLPVQSRRLRQAREAAGLSQKILGINAGLDEFVASTRINRYETGVHQPHARTMQRLADVLGLPLPYFYAEDDGLARLIANYRPKRSPGN